jgi:hypothetical protein
MSNPLKAIGKGVKKVFKGIGKVAKGIGKFAKKALKNKFVRIALIAAAAYFAGPYVMSALGGSTAAAGTTAAGSMATTAGASTMTPMAAGAAGGGTALAGSSAAAATTAGTAAMTPMAAGTAGGGTAWAVPTATGGSSGILGSLATGAKAVGGWAQANPLLASTALNMGGQMVKGYMEGKALEEEEKRRLSRSHFYGVNGYGQGEGIDPSGQLQDIAEQMSPYFQPNPGLLGQPQQG